MTMETTDKDQTATGRVFNFSWADDVDEEFGEVCTTLQQQSKHVPPKQETQIIEGARYRYAPGASKRVPAFSIKTADRRYEYEGARSPPSTQPQSPVAVNSNKQSGSQYKPIVSPVAQTSAQKQIWGRPAEKTRKRYKQHNKPTPPVLPSYEYYEATEVVDSFMGTLPNAKDVLERVDPPEVIEDLWADYKNKAPRRIFSG